MSGIAEMRGSELRNNSSRRETVKTSQDADGNTRIEADGQALAGKKVHNSSPDKNSEVTDLGGDPITLRASISILSVLRLVNDSELDDASGSIGVGGVLLLAGKKCSPMAEERRREKVAAAVECAAEREKYLLEKRGEVLRRAKASKTYLKPLNRGARKR